MAYFKRPTNMTVTRLQSHPNFVTGITAKLSPIIETSREYNKSSSTSSASSSSGSSTGSKSGCYSAYSASSSYAANGVSSGFGLPQQLFSENTFYQQQQQQPQQPQQHQQQQPPLPPKPSSLTVSTAAAETETKKEKEENCEVISHHQRHQQKNRAELLATLSDSAAFYAGYEHGGGLDFIEQMEAILYEPLTNPGYFEQHDCHHRRLNHHYPADD